MIRKIKILHVVNVFGGAVGRILVDLMPYFVKIFDVKVISIQSIDDSEVSIKKYINKYNNLESLNLNRYSLVKAYRKLYNYFNKINPDIIHSHMGRADILTAILSPQNVIIMNTLHCEKKNHNPLTQIGYRLTDRKVDWRVCISQTVARSYYHHGLKSPHSVIYNPIDIKKYSLQIDRMELREHMGFDKNDQIIINVGRLIECKGQKYLIEMMPFLYRLLPRVKLLIVGDGAQYNILTRLIDKYNLKGTVYLLGYRQDVQELLKMSDLFVYSAQWEGLGMAVIEAMASGIPVLAHPLPALKEYIIDGKNGYFCDVHDRELYAEKAYKILTDSTTTEKIVINALKTVEETFSVEKVALKYIKLYKQLINIE
jgi:glycosyltransferase involved in cell wall biosynthesis